jgi:NADH:ubiquinone oxidoreductase subunit C
MARHSRYPYRLMGLRPEGRVELGCTDQQDVLEHLVSLSPLFPGAVWQVEPEDQEKAD